MFPRKLTPEVLQALRGVRFIAQHIKDADKDNEVNIKFGSFLEQFLIVPSDGQGPTEKVRNKAKMHDLMIFFCLFWRKIESRFINQKKTTFFWPYFSLLLRVGRTLPN